MKNKPKKIKLPEFYTGPLSDLIPNEVMYDAFKFNTWVAVFFAGYAAITALEEGVDDKKRKGQVGILSAISPAFFALNWMFGSDDTGEGVGVIVDWGKMVRQEANKPDPNPLALAMLELMADDFMRRAIIASGIASTAVFTIYETKFMDNMLSGVGSIVEGAVPL